MRRTVFLIAIAVASCCARADTQDIRIHDAGDFVPSARLSVGLPKSMNMPSSDATFEVEYASGRGSDGQRIEAGAPVQFGGKTFSGPQDLRHDFAFQYFEAGLMIRTPLHWYPSLSYAVGVGFAFASVDLRVSDPTQTARENVNGLLYVARFGADWRFHPRGRLQASGAVFQGTKEPADSITDGGRADVSVAWTPWRHSTVHAGYSWWWLSSGRDGKVKSPIHMDFSGPALGLELVF